MPRFSRNTLLLTTAALAAATRLGMLGGTAWFSFVVILAACAALFRTGLDWAINGRGLWPSGVIGVVLYLLCIPALLLTLYYGTFLVILSTGHLPQLGWIFAPPL